MNELALLEAILTELKEINGEVTMIHMYTREAKEATNESKTKSSGTDKKPRQSNPKE